VVGEKAHAVLRAGLRADGGVTVNQADRNVLSYTIGRVREVQDKIGWDSTIQDATLAGHVIELASVVSAALAMLRDAISTEEHPHA
jgi:hypothetical protein